MNTDDDFDSVPAPNACGGYYCSEEHEHIDCIKPMTTKDKRFPTLTDTDPMPFGKHQGELMQDVPASYLAWLWRGGMREFSGNGELPGYVNEKRKLANYIWNSKGAIEMEIGETL